MPWRNGGHKNEKRNNGGSEISNENENIENENIEMKIIGEMAASMKSAIGVRRKRNQWQ
jgi:hypothetical protein